MRIEPNRLTFNVSQTQSQLITKSEKSELRSTIFKHLDGIVTAPAMVALHQHGVLDTIVKGGVHALKDLSNQFSANAGYFNVAMRTLASQGWVTVSHDTEGPKYEVTALGVAAIELVSCYEGAAELLKVSGNFHPRKFEKEPFQLLETVFGKYLDRKLVVDQESGLKRSALEQILVHIEGVILGPSIVHLGMSGMFHKYFMEASFKAEEFHEDAKSFEHLLDIFKHFGWFEKTGETYRFTEKGLFFSKRASAYGVTVSYMPTLRNLDALIFGNAAILQTSNDEDEAHVDRPMNVWGSGGAHATYFKVVDEIVIDLFNQPIEKQPKGILDMGCGNGAFLQHLFDVIDKHTLRGRHLDEHPLTLVGVDYNQAALKITKANLIQADIWAKVIWGDIGNPYQLAEDLKSNYGIELGSLLNVRTFLDHNRPWNAPEQEVSHASTAHGAYATHGAYLSSAEVEQSFVEHMLKWTPYLRQHGLLVIELHTVNPALVAQNLGKTGATAYDATHGYSDQYILEVEAYIKALKRAGLSTDDRLSKKFPNSNLASVTINLVRTA